MRLLDTETGQFVEKDPEARETVYAILSHTWDKGGEQTFEELKKIQWRYSRGPQAQQGGRVDPKACTSSYPSSKYDQLGPSPPPPPPRLPDDSSSLMACPPAGLGRFTQSEVEALFRAFVETCSLTSSTLAPASNHLSLTATECQAMEPPQSIWDDPELSPKVRNACKVAQKNGFRYIWIDSCCIDKSSSSELSEAINSMYRWYGLATVCYAYLADVPCKDDHKAEGSAFRESRWFTRGWTLQELIAPVNVVFLSKDWAPIGSKQALINLVESVTGINARALLHLKPLEGFSVAQRLSWAASRETTRKEDRAYSLLGMFDINMPTLYGEGDRAFRRLQEQIMQRFPDQSLFAWGEVYLPGAGFPGDPPPAHNPIITLNAQTWGPPPQSPSADSPGRFMDSGKIRHVQLPASHRHEIEYTFTPYGIRTQFPMIPLTSDLLSAALPHNDVTLVLPDDSRWYLALLGCEHVEHPRYLLGRVCYIPPSTSGIDFVYSGSIAFRSDAPEYVGPSPDLFLLSLEALERARPHTELKTVYIPHPEPVHTDSGALLRLKLQAYAAVQLVLLTETRDALRARGYEAELHDPGLDRPDTHWLVLSTNEHTITVQFRHTLENGGEVLTITAEVELSGSRVQLDSASHSDRRTVSWSDTPPWYIGLSSQSVALSVAGAGTLTVDLGLDFAGNGVYVVCVDVHSDRNALSASPDNVPGHNIIPAAGVACG